MDGIWLFGNEMKGEVMFDLISEREIEEMKDKLQQEILNSKNSVLRFALQNALGALDYLHALKRRAEFTEHIRKESTEGEARRSNGV